MGQHPRMAARIALVTGANKGIGFAVARGLAERGHVVLLGARDRARGEVAAQSLAGVGDVRALPIDLTDPESVQSAADRIRDEFGHLDVLVNNAAVKLEFHPSPPSQVSLATVRETYETNVFGTITVLQAMLPLLLAAPAGRVVNVSSSLGSNSLSANPRTLFSQRPLLGYNSAKAALNSVTLQLANELRATAVKVNAADPGYVATDMTNHDGERTTEQGAAVILRLATLDDDGPTGGFFDDRGPVPW